MDYVVGSVAALISGNVTPNRPKLIRRALTPTKHQPSPNVTPKSEIEDRSIFLSPTLQKKKAIVKKSPKRIFENPNLDTTEDENNSPKADKVKKHLKDELESDSMGKNKKSKSKPDKNPDLTNPSENSNVDDSSDNIKVSPKKKNKRNSETKLTEDVKNIHYNDQTESVENETKPKKKKQKKKPVDNESNEINKSIDDNINDSLEQSVITNNDGNKKKNKKRKKKNKNQDTVETVVEENKSTAESKDHPPLKKNKNKKSKMNNLEIKASTKQKKKSIEMEIDESDKETDIPNPNAITHKDTDSEHDSDDEMNSENEENNKEVLKTEEDNESSDEEVPNKSKVSKVPELKPIEINTKDEIRRTIFVGNVPLSKTTKKDIKKIFNKYGQIETIRIRAVPVKDARVSPKVAVIKNELHPERSTVNVYVKFADKTSVEKALAENNTVLNNHHLRVSRSDSTGAENDPQLAIFVGNLPFSIEDEQFRAMFEKCGDIKSVRVIRDKKTNAGKGFGYVNFATKDGVELALNLSEEDLTINNKILRVKRCTHTLGKIKGTPHKQQPQQKLDGVQRRLMYKRKFQDNNEGPPNKRPNINQPSKEKKQRKEFVGMTSEKKKKHKFDKGQKKKKILSQILTKKKP